MNSLSKCKINFLDAISCFLQSGKVSHAYLIEVSNYSEDMFFVFSFIKMLLCNMGHYTLDSLHCSNCSVCDFVENNCYPDLRIIEPDGQWIRKSQLLDLQSDFGNCSLFGGKRIYVIKQADRLNVSSANTMLKFLEEPEDNIIAILLTTNRYKVLDTILSRCQVLSLNDQNFHCSFSSEVISLLEFIVKREELFLHYQQIFSDLLPDKNKDLVKTRLQEISEAFIFYLNFISNQDDFVCPNDITSLLEKVDQKSILHFVFVIEEFLEKLDYNVNYKLWLDSFFAKLIGG